MPEVIVNKEHKSYEIEVYVCFYSWGDIYVTAGENGKAYKPLATDGTVERYTFNVTDPTEAGEL